MRAEKDEFFIKKRMLVIGACLGSLGACGVAAWVFYLSSNFFSSSNSNHLRKMSIQQIKFPQIPPTQNLGDTVPHTNFFSYFQNTGPMPGLSKPVPLVLETQVFSEQKTWSIRFLKKF